MECLRAILALIRRVVEALSGVVEVAQAQGRRSASSGKCETQLGIRFLAVVILGFERSTSTISNVCIVFKEGFLSTGRLRKMTVQLV